MKVIKLTGRHYIVVDDSEIQEGDYAIHNNKRYREQHNEQPLLCTKSNHASIQEHWDKITHSTEPFKDGSYYPMNVTVISVEEVEEAIYGYDVEKMMRKWVRNPSEHLWVKSLVKELTKDKLFTVEDMKKAFELGQQSISDSKVYLKFEDNIQLLLPPTEWEVEFVDGKLKLK